MKNAWAVIVVAAVASFPGVASAQPAAAGAIVGRVRFTGEVPQPQKVLASDGQWIEFQELKVEPRSKGFRDVLVSIETKSAVKFKETKPHVIDQKDMMFLPRISAVLKGQKVRFENSDLCNHAVSGTSTKQENSFNASTPPGQSIEVEFVAQKPPVLIGCPIHAWMRAYVFVFDHPYFAMTGDDGRFRIGSVPPGEYKVLFRHPDAELTETRSVRVEAGRDVLVEVEWKSLPRRR